MMRDWSSSHSHTYKQPEYRNHGGRRALKSACLKRKRKKIQMLFWFLDMAKLWALRCFSVCACVGEYVWFRIGSNTTCQEYQRLGQSQIMWEVKYTNKPSRSRSLLCLCVSSCPYLLCDWRWRIVMMSSGFGCLRSVLSHNQEVLFWLTPCFWNLPYTFFFFWTYRILH